MRESIVPGAVLTGRVASVLDFGAFVDLGGGIQGLLHVSDMSWSRVTTPGEIVAPGDQITVKVLRVDDATEKISLGLKQLLDDPWTRVAGSYQVGQVRTGRVTRVAPFGAFVELEPGIEGLAHVSTFAPTGRSGGWAESVTPGMTGAFEILSIDPAEKRIGVALVDEASSRAAGATSPQGALAPGAIMTGKVERHESFGVFVFLSPGRTGLIPLSETGVERGTDLRTAFPIGSEVEVAVLEIDAAGRRIRLSKKAVAEQREQRRTARVRRAAGRRAHDLARIAGRQPAQRPQGALRGGISSTRRSSAADAAGLRELYPCLAPRSRRAFFSRPRRSSSFVAGLTARRSSKRDRTTRHRRYPPTAAKSYSPAGTRRN